MLSLWDLEDRTLLSRTILEAAGTCCDFHKSNGFVAVGTAVGGLYIYAVREPSSSKSTSELLTLQLCAFRKDCSG